MAKYTDLSAVNSILRAANMPPVTAVPSTNDGSAAAQAKEVLDECSAYEQSKGWPANTVNAIQFTADGNGNIYFADTVLNVHCVAPGRYQGNVVVREGKAYITTEGSDNFGAGTNIYLDTTFEMVFANAPIDLQRVIVEAARQRYVLENFRNPVMNDLMQAAKDDADHYADRQSLDRRGFPKNLSPMSRGGGGARDGGGQ